MKKLLLLSIIGITSILCINPSYANLANDDDFNSEKKSYEVSFFNEIVAGYKYEIEVIKSDKCAVEVLFEDEEDTQYAKIYTKDKTLFLKMENRPNSFFNNNQGDIKVKVYLTELYSIKLSGASELKTTENFVTENFYIQQSGASDITGLDISGTRIEVQCSGSSDLKLTGNHIEAKYSFGGSSDGRIQQNTVDLIINLSGSSDLDIVSNSENLEARISGSSDLKINGTGNNAEISCSGASDFSGESFSCKNAIISGSGASGVELNISENLDVKLSGASSLTYYGQPKIGSMDVSRGSDLKSR